ncbi:DUF3987 domain-containing protein [Paenirhodobacter populi]|uniref:DUF3987 domain-containing protein n=1 Tax=Paenirhodobacter populi TaxID=2306993 RepID=A0A443J6G9_9RHOB|nr:DUF3987 domain-containing protein [Sinirhodobacter populi]RWR15983.1 DUF3987 domain-containing protein [Sinirhodobacter populi]
MTAPMSNINPAFAASVTLKVRSRSCGKFLRVKLTRSRPTGDNPQELAPVRLPLSQGARELLWRFYQAGEAAQATGRQMEHVRSYGSKAAEQAARIAGVQTLWGGVEAPEVTPEAMGWDNGTVRGLGHVVSPNGGADPARLSAARTLDQHGIQTTARQKVGNDTLRRMEAATGAGRSRLSAQDEQFTQAALCALGTDAKRATPEVLEQTQRRIGQVFDDVLGNVSIRPDPGVSQRATAAMDTYRELAPATEAAPLITNVGQRLIDAASSGQNIAGQTARA